MMKDLIFNNLNVTRGDMIAAGHAPSVRLFEAAACGVPVISDEWPGLDTFFIPGKEIFVCASSTDTLRLLREIPEEERRKVAKRARLGVLAGHTASRRADQLQECFDEVRKAKPRRIAR